MIRRYCLIGILLMGLLIAGCSRPAPPAGTDWTILVYLAGDNNLNYYAGLDLAEMVAANSNAGINVVIQYDPAGTASTKRLLIRQGAQTVVQDLLAETNTGDPQVLQNFLTWGADAYPASHYALILWNHGSGTYDPPETRGLSGERGGMQPNAVAFDDAAGGDALATTEYAQAIRNAESTGGFHLDLLAFDACLMQMVEVGTELVDGSGAASADYMVGSEYVTSAYGYDYTDVLTWLSSNLTANGGALAAYLVSSFATTFAGTDMTISAVHLAGANWNALLTDLAALSAAITTADAPTLAQIKTAAANSRNFVHSGDYLEDKDLADFAGQLAAGVAGSTMASLGTQVLEHLTGSSPVITSLANSGKFLDGKTHGLAVVLPTNPTDYGFYAGYYQNLRFAELTGWDQVIALLGQ